MSGGSFDYAYSKLDELNRWPAILRDMATHCRDWSADERAGRKWDSETRKDIPTSLQERASILVRAMLLENAATRLQGAIDEVKRLEDVMHDVEWVASGDYGLDSLMDLPKVAP